MEKYASECIREQFCNKKEYINIIFKITMVKLYQQFIASKQGDLGCQFLGYSFKKISIV